MNLIVVWTVHLVRAGVEAQVEWPPVQFHKTSIKQCIKIFRNVTSPSSRASVPYLLVPIRFEATQEQFPKSSSALLKSLNNNIEKVSNYFCWESQHDKVYYSQITPSAPPWLEKNIFAASNDSSGYKIPALQQHIWAERGRGFGDYGESLPDYHQRMHSLVQVPLCSESLAVTLKHVAVPANIGNVDKMHLYLVSSRHQFYVITAFMAIYNTIPAISNIYDIYVMSFNTENSPNLNLYFVVCRSTKHKFTLLMSFCSLCYLPRF